jgi:hypothetical protein
MFEASPYTADIIQKEPYKSDAMNSAFALHNGLPPYQWYAEHPDKAARFAAAMAGYVKSERSRFCHHSLNITLTTCAQ